MDEVGRGTTVKDGLAIAFATVYHLYNVNRCRAIFATHFHEVVDMLGYTDDSGAQGFFKNIGFFCTDVDETQVSPSYCVIYNSTFSGWAFCIFTPPQAWCEQR
jgi:DNA mismatch repair ATPase MutS